MAAGFLERLLGHPGEREDAAEALDSRGPSLSPRRDRSAAPAEAVLRETIAQKVLHAWAQNRQQVLVPLTVNLSRLEPASRALVVQAMAAAAMAGGRVTQEGRDRLTAALRRTGGGPEELALAERALTQPMPMAELLAALETARLGAHAFAASLLVADRREAVERAWLDYLAARFALPTEVTVGLGRRYRV